MRLLALSLILAAGPLVAEEGVTGAPPGASACTGCHGPASAMPLTGLGAGDISAATLAFRGGEGTLMPRLVAGFTDVEIEAIAAWLAAQGEG